jgi:hypothetical protein
MGRVKRQRIEHVDISRGWVAEVERDRSSKVDVSHGYMSMAATVARSALELIDQVMEGGALDQAYKLAQERKAPVDPGRGAGRRR